MCPQSNIFGSFMVVQDILPISINPEIQFYPSKLIKPIDTINAIDSIDPINATVDLIYSKIGK